MNGSNHDPVGSPNDPYFFLHHSFIDKIFEMWIRLNKVDGNQFPVTGAAPGHNRNDPIVPFFPQVLQHQWLNRSENFGYTYDNDLLGSKNYNS